MLQRHSCHEPCHDLSATITRLSIAYCIIYFYPYFDYNVIYVGNTYVYMNMDIYRYVSMVVLLIY